MSSSTPSTKGVYIPPHLRNRPSSSPSPSSSRRSQPPATPPSGQRSYASAPDRNHRSPWAPSSSSSSSHPGRSFFMGANNNNLNPSPSGRNDSPSISSPGRNADNRNRNGPSASSSGYSSSPSLYVYGDSFVGPFKLLREDSVRVQTFKGSSAKGLNNPKSIKQVSRDLLPLMNGLLAPPPYAYMPSAGRWVMLIFGNVDLQINYLWQLANKPISHLSFPLDRNSPPIKSSDEEDEDPDDFPSSQSRSRRSSNVLATATETSARGPALGPELFVEGVVKAYTAWLEREIINGPIGERLTENLKQNDPKNTTASPGVFRRKAPPSKVLIAAALPPLVEDELLPRIPEKYVERLEEDHSKAQKAFERSNGNGHGSVSPIRGSGSPTPASRQTRIGDDALEVGLSTLSVSDDAPPKSPSSPKSTSSSSNSTNSTLFDSQRTDPSTATTVSSFESALLSTITSPLPKDASASSDKTSVEDLLKHDPPLCTLPVRVSMTNRYNDLMRAFCERYPDILEFIDITDQMKLGSEAPSIHGEVDRGVWACPVDPTNVHPLWEPTLPLWKDELKKVGLPTDTWRISEDAEETFRAYEVDKRRRTEKRGDQRNVGVVGDRIKLRDE
ncbi:uncharacterized protein I303_106198 [Kwoniella dejecticola CBS 10117]|uniref:Uncharacterized protein n=1 Tax=Kwoniella dejecticola CBS 10117 TaxID=1296121 RepID=A0A1A6A1L2_9TREE|nr:uncharacterized protein I303_06216 [Kwoniella dejecticola CBS 10117]OBR83930.1 hypothetical protein I303_06216 [Kwoniella dejecticola CBS 10117]